MRFFVFAAGFFRNAAPESSTRLVGILSFAVGLALASVLVVRSCTGSNVTERAITWTDIVVVFGVLTYACVALNLRSPFPPELFASLAGVKPPTVVATIETTKTASVETKLEATTEVKTS